MANCEKWITRSVRSLPIGSVAFDQTNAYLLAFTKNGEVVEWAVSGEKPAQLSSHKVTAFPLRKAFFLHDEKRCVVVVDHGSHLTVNNLMSEKSLATIANLPADLRNEQIAVTSHYVTYCNGKEVFVIPFEEDSDFPPSNYTCKTHIEGLTLLAFTKNGEVVEWAISGEKPSQLSSHKVTAFPVRKAFFLHDEKRCVVVVDHGSHLTVNNLMSQKSLATIANLPAGLRNEQIAVTSYYVTYCNGKEVFVIPFEEDSDFPPSNYTCKTHIEAPSIALTQFGGLLSAGAEAVLCKFTLSGAGRPNMLPRLPAPVRDLAISADASHLAVILEDNSLHVVATASMNVLSTLETVTCFSLENVADGDMSFAGITQTFPDVEQVFFTKSTIVTLETVINFEEEHKRLRFWERSQKSDSAVQIVESFIVSKDTVSITGCKQPSSNAEEMFLSVMKSGKVNVWIPREEGTRFKLDPVRQIDRQYEFRIGSVIHNKMWASAHPEGANDTDVVAIWNTSDMSEIDVLRTDGRVSSVQFDEKSHLVCATDKAVRCWKHTAMQFEFLWIVEQPLMIHVSSFGGFAWHENDVMEFDVETAALISSFHFAAPITDLLATKDDSEQVIVVARSEKGLLFACPKSHQSKKAEESSNVAGKTPFASLAPVETSAQTPSSGAPLRPAAKTAAVHLFDGPCHALPPVSHLAPLFIAQCLAPPLPERR
ncbi:hypothetical protein NECAME_04372 [Necator americanus]|uniref:Uncharacterized protein n=1 Tax=Necator americanus TaxID=51031 RepID=W2STH9_NECAM|nr:hypothetical protein NECAME_04372 [Necator americanus]ETN73064.1 hypothetical protein NECAME_04372 [Necator americanus]